MGLHNLNSNDAELEEKQTVYHIDTNESLEDLSSYLSIRYQDEDIASDAKAYTPVTYTAVRKPVTEPSPKWHWGAFFFPYYWTFKHGLAALGQLFIVVFLIRLVLTHLYTGIAASLLAHICSLGLLAIAGYCGLKGYQHGLIHHAGNNGVESYTASQAVWTKWGFIVNIPICLIFVGSTVIGAISASSKSMQPPAYVNQSASVRSAAPKNNPAAYYNYSAPVVYQRTGSSASTSRPLN